MLVLYKIGIRLYYIFVIIASVFNVKAKRWLNGRRQQKVVSLKQSIWFHFASLGEFEQGRPVLEAVKEQHPAFKIIVTFFSPSGYEIRKNTPLADAVYYLPLDTASNARQFIKQINPVAAIFTKYEYWFHYFNELHRKQIPLYVISAIFRPDQLFFKWYGGLHRRMLSYVTMLFVQDEASKTLLQTINIKQVEVSGDTRFDRVWHNAQMPKPLPLVEPFTNGQPVFIAGSTWPKDEELIASIANRYSGWKIIIAPHEIDEAKISKLLNLLPKEGVIRYSMIPDNQSSVSDFKILIIDNIGMLSFLYQYGNIAYIGGGFGAGIHNTLEAAAFGMPVIFGPNYKKFKEAKELINLNAAFSINDEKDLLVITDKLINDADYRLCASAASAKYVSECKGATDIIMNNIHIKD